MEWSNFIIKNILKVLKCILVVQLQLSIFQFSCGNAQLPTMSGSGREVLGHHGQYVLEWKLNLTAKTITFDIKVNATGWIGLGLSKDGKMKKADLVIVAFHHKDGRPYIQDMYADEERHVQIDRKQNWQLLAFSRIGGFTLVQIARAWDTCDDKSDYRITADLINVLWAYGETDEIEYHFDKRGSFRVHILDPYVESEANLQMFPLVSPVTLPPRVTYYHCKIHKGPRLNRKHHMVEFHPHLEGQVSVTHTHHMLIYMCAAPPGMAVSEIFEPLLDYPGEECYFSNNHKIPINLCRLVIWAWDIGAKPFKLPPSTGISIGDVPDVYFMTEVHFNNQEAIAGINVVAGMDVYYTPNLRENDGGALFIGSDVQALFIVPPVSTDFVVPGMCSGECTRQMFPEEGVEILAANLHAHYSGKSMVLEHFRGNETLKPIMKDLNFDPTYQQSRLLHESRKVLPGDILVMRCTYDNSFRNDTVVSGFWSSEEMCLGFLLVTKRIAYVGCGSRLPTKTLLPLVGLEGVEWNITSYDRDITGPPSEAGRDLLNYLNDEINWTKKLRGEIQDLSYQPQAGYCPRILLPPTSTKSDTEMVESQSMESVHGVIIHSSEEATPENVLQLAYGYGEETLMGRNPMPGKTPGHRNSVTYSGQRVLTPDPRQCLLYANARPPTYPSFTPNDLLSVGSETPYSM